MELREYARVLWRHWWLILLLPLLAGLFSIVTYDPPPVTYGYTLQYSVSFQPVERNDLNQDPRLGAVQVSEYVADDLTEIFRGSRFNEMVQQYLPAGQQVGVTNVTRSSKVHRLVSLDLQAGTPEQVTTLAAAIKQAVAEDMKPLLDEMWGTGDLRLELVNESGAFPIGGGLRSRLDVPLRVALALVAAVALAFALDYLDDSVRTREEAEQLVGPVLGEIPK